MGLDTQITVPRGSFWWPPLAFTAQASYDDDDYVKPPPPPHLAHLQLEGLRSAVHGSDSHKSALPFGRPGLESLGARSMV